MPNYISFTTPASGNFTVSAGVDGQSPLYSKTWTVIQPGTTVLKFYATGTTTPEIPQDQLVVGNYYDVYAFRSDGVTPKDVDWSGTNIEFIEPFAYTADRRPIFQGGYATQKYSKFGDITFGVFQQDYRKTPPTNDPMNSTATNGKLKWLTDKIKPAADRGFERFQLWNIAGWTSDSENNSQPHYPSNSYTGLSLTQAPMYVTQNSTTGVIMQDTPFTENGMSTGSTPGDNEQAWTAGVAALKSWVTTATPAATPEITAYQGYRPCYANATLPYTIQKTQLGYSKSSTTTAGWTGTGASPGFTPEPGFDGPGGYTTSPEAMAAWFDEEFIGLRSLGFDGIALDTGTRVYDNAAGYANGTIPAEISNPDGTSSNALVNYFNSWGIKPTFEAVGLDTWTDGTGKKAIPATDGRYAASAYCALFGAWWGYEGNANGEQVVTADYDKAGTTETEAPSGGYVFGDAVGGPKVGNGANAAAFTAEAEVHVIFQWGNGTYMSRIMQGTPPAGDAQSGNGVGWTGMKQIMWDCRAAGLIVSAAGSMSTTMTVIDPNTAASEDITPEMFLDYVKLLYTNPSLERPTNSDVLDYTNYMAANAGANYNIVLSGTSTYGFTATTGGSDTPGFDRIQLSLWASSGTTQSGIVVPAPASYNKGIVGSYNDLTNSRQFCAVGYQEAGNNYLSANTAGWVICEVEQLPAGSTTADVNHLSYIPIEGTDGMMYTPYTPGTLPLWPTQGATSADVIVFFFDGYNNGDVQTWTTWDGVTVP